ncbi:Epsin-3, clathrin recruitment and traffic between the Golgi and endosome [Apophysomyces sp. BC1034]|nr:Epsin-3, clathrin recruitment and traffic between the Golgi and endosome [Apophysomyces sp. BC1015]KAG0178949.1 Epsin-3, clathrin recruitment and traffic between the Golgi and endosome [Apophysomyces sp. BC1021]KAG0189423.1 Epsin-3, clathrin recruitment and traffic between the Golgi and endosome [Apophysomyces sp. BC1034]
MEAKVHEATNNEAWGASSTLMQEIAQGTYNYQYFNEIMPTVYKRFTEKEAKQWRQIYKALVLLEYLVKNGSERVVDDARSHISMIKIMRNFHYIDEKGKDQGINIRNRAKELAELLSNTDLIKSERKKARVNRNKYTGVGSDTMYGMGSGVTSGGGNGGGGSRFTGFGSDTGFSGDGIGHSSTFYDEDERSNRYESSKYDDFDDTSSSSRNQNRRVSSSSSSASRKVETKQPANAKEANLFDFDEPKQSRSAAHNDDDWGDFASGGLTTTAATAGGNDDFDDFQSAPVAPAVAAGAKKNDIFDLLGDDAFSTPVQTPTHLPPTPQQPISISPIMSTPMSPSEPLALNSSSNNNNNSNGKQSPAIATQQKNELPGGIWSQASSFVSLDSLGKTNNQPKQSVGLSMNAMKNSSTSAGWNAWASSNQTQSVPSPKQPPTTARSPFDDLLS